MSFIWESRCQSEFEVGRPTLYVRRVTTPACCCSTEWIDAPQTLPDTMTLHNNTTCPKISTHHLLKYIIRLQDRIQYFGPNELMHAHWVTQYDDYQLSKFNSKNRTVGYFCPEIIIANQCSAGIHTKAHLYNFLHLFSCLCLLFSCSYHLVL